MPYVSTIPVEFSNSPESVYRALCDLSSYSLWNSGMVRISPLTHMEEGMKIEFESIVAGKTSLARATVVRLVENQEIELVNVTGLISYRATYRLVATSSGKTTVTCTLKFEFRNFVLNLTKSTIEAMAQAHIRGNLEALRAIIDGQSEAEPLGIHP